MSCSCGYLVTELGHDYACTIGSTQWGKGTKKEEEDKLPPLSLSHLYLLLPPPCIHNHSYWGKRLPSARPRPGPAHIGIRSAWVEIVAQSMLLNGRLFKAEESVSVSRRSTQALTTSSIDPSLSLHLSFPLLPQCSSHRLQGFLLIFRFDCRVSPLPGFSRDDLSLRGREEAERERMASWFLSLL